MFKIYIMKTIYYLIVSLLFLSACSDKNEGIYQEEPPTLELGFYALNFEEDGGEKEMVVKTNKELSSLTVTAGEDWCITEVRDEKLYVKVSSNPEKVVRSTSVDVVLGSLKETFTVSQLGWGKALLLSPKSVELEQGGGTAKVEITTNIEYSYTIPADCDWLTEKTDKSRAGEHPVVTKAHEFIVAGNMGEARSAVIEFKDVEENSEFKPVSFYISQKRNGEYEPGSPDEIKDDVQVSVSSATASHTWQHVIERSYDGDLTTFWHSDNLGNKGPVELVYNFEPATNLDYVVYIPRINASGNGGYAGEVEVSYQTSEGTWSEATKHDFKMTKDEKRVDFPSSPANVTAVKIKINTGGGNLATCAEMKFYKKNPDNFDWSTLFTDVTCSELKPGVAEEEILKCGYSMFRNVAYHMYRETYPREFRIVEYEAKANPDVEAKRNKTFPHSRLDNPTGIFMESGEEMVVLADLKGQTDISLRVQNLDKPVEVDDYREAVYHLSHGINKLKMIKKGLVYVEYNKENFEQCPPIKLHFLNGKVNGYFDSQNPAHEGRWRELLNNAEDKYFDVLGKNAHLIFPVQRFKDHTRDLKELIDVYDKLVDEQYKFMGLYKYTDYAYNNRMCFIVIYEGLAYAAPYNSMYHDGMLANICDIDKLKTTEIWGPAHEVGHCNQTTPGFDWHNLKEVSVNMMPLYLQTVPFGQPSRFQEEVCAHEYAFPNRYTKAWNQLLGPKKAHHQSDGSSKVVPFWQLQLYFGNVLGRTPDKQSDGGGFYPDLYQCFREKTYPTPMKAIDQGRCQVEFAYEASKIAGYDLTEFFEKWGFFLPITVKDGYTGKNDVFVVTEALATEVKNAIKGLNFPKLENIPLEYISDNNWTTFRDKGNITVGTSVRNGAELTFTNWNNVIVFEVRDGSATGELICASEGKSSPSNTAKFKVCKNGAQDPEWKDTYKVYAVQHDNQRIEVKF